jgi:hypothetical protein
VTAAGRTIGIVLMIVGVGIFGVVAASAAAWFISASQEEDVHQQAAKITALTVEITALRQTVSELSARLAASHGGQLVRARGSTRPNRPAIRPHKPSSSATTRSTTMGPKIDHKPQQVPGPGN